MLFQEHYNICYECGKHIEDYSEIVLCEDCHKELSPKMSDEKKLRIYRIIETINAKLGYLSNKFWQTYDCTNDIKLMLELQDVVLGEFKPRPSVNQLSLNL